MEPEDIWSSEEDVAREMKMTHTEVWVNGVRVGKSWSELRISNQKGFRKRRVTLL